MLGCMRAHLQSALLSAKEALQLRAEDFYQDMAAARLDALELKMRVFNRVEQLQQLERERLDIDKRDLLLRQVNMGVSPFGTSVATSSAAVGMSSLSSSASLLTYR